MGSELPAEERYIQYRGHQVWCRIVGDREDEGKLPILALHGGPGIPHDYMEPMEAMARTGRRIVFYDQLGCGRSDQPHDPSVWTIPLFVDEVDAVRAALGLDRIHLLGQSWGGMLAQEYMLTRPAGVASLILADSLASTPQWVEEGMRLRTELPPDVQRALTEHEAAGTTDSPDYAAATMEFYRRHVCRVDPWPTYVVRAFDQLERNPEVYHTMWGPSEVHPTGVLKSWDIVSRLGEIAVPTLIITGRYDEATPAIAQTMAQAIPQSEWVLFEHSSHMPHVEEPERFIAVLDDFLTRVEN